METLLQTSGLAFAAGLVLAVSDWLAVHHNVRKVEYALKPATLLAVIVAAWLIVRGPHDTWQARFFLPGLVFSLAGDVFLMLPGQGFFLPGLVSFLLAHLCYIAGLNSTLPPGPAWALLIPIALAGGALFRGIAGGLRRSGQNKMLGPVALYSLVLSLMVWSAWTTLFRPEWTGLRRTFAIAGASLFFASDAMLAWDRFVEPSPSARLRVMVTYHLGQMALAASMAMV